MKKVLHLVIQFAAFTASSQSLIVGTVIDNGTNQPMRFVDVYLASTSTGSSTDNNGSFRFVVKNKGKFDLVASFVGYATIQIPLLITVDSTRHFDIRLRQKSSELPDIVVRADTSSRKKDFAEFKRFFLGETKNASSCKIKNPKDIYVYTDEAEHVLVAFAKAPIILESRSLGYRILYDLQEFEFNYTTDIIHIKGIPRFQELTSASEHENEHLNRVRKKLYEGSLMHLLYSILNNRLPEEGWNVTIEYPWIRKPEEFIKSKIRFHRNFNNWDSVNYYKEMRLGPPHSKPLHGSELMSENDKHLLIFKGTIRIEFRKGRDERYVPLTRGSYSAPFQKSMIKFQDKPTRIYDNGYYEPQQNLFVEGYFSWISRIGDLLPYDFQTK